MKEEKEGGIERKYRRRKTFSQKAGKNIQEEESGFDIPKLNQFQITGAGSSAIHSQWSDLVYVLSHWTFEECINQVKKTCIPLFIQASS